MGKEGKVKGKNQITDTIGVIVHINNRGGWPKGFWFKQH